MVRNVKGILFADYVRMLRGFKGVQWARYLHDEDLPYLATRIEPAQWYPMETFERLGNAILTEIAIGDLEAVRSWGRISADPLFAAQPMLVADGDPAETLMRFRVLRNTYFDFEALDIPMLHDGEAHVSVRYHMGAMAEEAASYQTMGFFERLIELAGASDVDAHFTERSWRGDARTIVALSWRAG